MRDALNLLLALLLGTFLGAAFFGGLWWTIRKGVSSRVPALWFLGSILLRTAITVVGFYLVGHRDWHRLLACLLGFLLARTLATRLTRAPREKRTPLVRAGGA
jgi:F1F0 ATPase subunit 2